MQECPLVYFLSTTQNDILTLSKKTASQWITEYVETTQTTTQIHTDQEI